MLEQRVTVLVCANTVDNKKEKCCWVASYRSFVDLITRSYLWNRQQKKNMDVAWAVLNRDIKICDEELLKKHNVAAYKVVRFEF